MSPGQQENFLASRDLVCFEGFPCQCQASSKMFSTTPQLIVGAVSLLLLPRDGTDERIFADEPCMECRTAKSFEVNSASNQ